MAHFVPKTDPKDIHVYDDNGKLITNPDTLHSIIEGQLIIADWLKRHEPYEFVEEEEEVMEDEAVGK